MTLAARAAATVLLSASVLICSAAHRAHANPPGLFSTPWFATLQSQRAGAASGAGGVGAPNAIGTPQAVGTPPAVAQSVTDFARAAQAIAQAQAAQAQAAQAAAAAASTVPDGVGPGGLQPQLSSTGAPLWTNATLLPASTTAAGRSEVTVQQSNAQAVLNWSSFNVGRHTDLTFDQSAGGSAANTWVALNLVNDPSGVPSQILGSISAQGEVLVVNHNGIIFGAGAQVNVGALVAATGNLANGVAGFLSNGIYTTGFSNGAYAPSFTGATNGISVAPGASIVTNAPVIAANAGSTNAGGFVMLLGSSVENDGLISTPDGQTILAAGQSVILRPGYGNNTGFGNAQVSTTLGAEAAVTGGGAATNTGLIQATTGDITMVGQTVTQAGVAYATTSVTQRGTIHLLTNATDPTTSVTLAPGSVTTILPDTSGATASNAQRETLIGQSLTGTLQTACQNTAGCLLNDQILLPDRFDESRVEITAGGTVDFGNGSLTMATGGQLAVSAGQRVLAETGALLDAAGSANVALPAMADMLQVDIQGFQLRDSPANRDSTVLNSNTVYVNIGQLVLVPAGTDGYGTAGNSAYDRYYTPGGLLEVGGELGNVPQTIQQWTASGGSIVLSSSQVVAQPGATFNIAGGTLNYQAGQVPAYWLIGSNGRLYNINTAPSNLTYTGLYSGFTVDHSRWGITQTFGNALIAPATIYQGAYTVGRDAGTLVISAPTDIFEAAIDAGVVAGSQQDAARPTGSAAASLALLGGLLLPSGQVSSETSTIDPFLLPQTTVPLAGSLVLANLASGVFNSPPFTTDVQISDSIPPLAASLGVTTTVPTARQNTTWIAASLLDSAGLGGLTIATSGVIAIASPLTLASGGQVNLLSPSVSITAPLTARSGSVTITNNALAASGSIDFLTLANSQSSIGVTLGDGGAIDTRGLFSNLLLSPGDLAGEGFANGGAVSIDSSLALALEPGSLIDASAGGVVLASGKTTGAAGGAISLVSYDPAAYGGSAPTAQSMPVIAGTLRSYGSISPGVSASASTRGGALTIEVPGTVLISDAPGAASPSELVLPSAFFAAGFSSYTIESDAGITVGPGTQLQVLEPIYQFTPASLAAPSGSDPAAAMTLTLPPLYQANPATAQVAQRPAASLTLQSSFGANGSLGGPVDVGSGAAITVDPGGSVTIQALGQITIDGSITAPGGTISLINTTQQTAPDAAPSYQPGLSIWLGATSVLDASAQAFTATDMKGRPFGVVPAGGSIQIGSAGNANANSTDAYIIARPGSVIEAAGTSALIDPAAGTGGTAGTRLVASNGGSIALDSTSGLVLNGSIIAPSGGPGAQGGSFSASLVTPDYIGSEGITQDTPNRVLVPRELVVGAGPGGVTLPSAAQPGYAMPDTAIGQAYVTTGLLSAGGFDSVTLASSDAVMFDGSVTLTAGRAITLNASILADTGTAGGVSIVAPYVTLNGGVNQTFSGALAAQDHRITEMKGGDWVPSAQVSSATFSIAADNLDIAGNAYFGALEQVPQSVTGKTTLTACTNAICTADLAGFAQVTLASSGDTRFLPGTSTSAGTTDTSLTTPGNLTFIAGQIYPVAGANAFVTAGFNFVSSNAFLPNGILSIQPAPGPTPAVPLTAGGSIQFAAGTIDQAGVVRAPSGQIKLGNNFGGTSPAGPQITGYPLAVNLLPGSITSVSMNGATIPYGGTSDGVTYTVNGTAPSLNLTTAPQIAVFSQAVTVSPGATLDLSGGGTLAGAGFISGRGGSADVLFYPLLALTTSGAITAPSQSSNPVYAIIPGFSGAPPPPASASAYAGSVPQVGQAITIPTGVPGLPAGTYTLLPGSDALLPGAYRVQINTATYTPSAWRAGAVNIGNGSYQVDGYSAVAGTAFQAGLPVLVTVTPGTAVLSLAQYDQETFTQFQTAQAALKGSPLFGTPIPEDAKTLTFTFAAPNPAGPSLEVQGNVNMQAAAGGIGGIVQITTNGNSILVTPDGAAPSTSAISIPASSLDALNAETLVVGGSFYTIALPQVSFTNISSGVTMLPGATLAASQVFLVGGPLTIEPGAGIVALGRGTPALNSDSGLVFSSVNVSSPGNNASVVAVSNGNLTFLPAGPGTGAVSIGQCPTPGCSGTSPLYSDGTVAISTGASVTIGSAAQFGAEALDLSVSSVNIGTPAAGQPVPTGLNLNQATLDTLVSGVPSVGIPPLGHLILAANQSVNFYGSTSLASSSLSQIELDTPAIYGAGGPNDAATLSTGGTLIWNGIYNPSQSASTPPGPWLTGGPGAGSGALTINAANIVLGYGPNEQYQNQTTLTRLMLGFSGVTLNASQSITTANRGSLAVYQAESLYQAGTGTTYSGGNLTLVTPLLEGGAGSVNSIATGAALVIAAPAGGPVATAGMGAAGAEIDLSAASISNATSVALPSGRLVMQASGNITLAAGSYLDLAGRAPTLFGQAMPGFGGAVVLQSTGGNITQAPGTTIDVSAVGSDAGSLTVTTTGGQVSLDGALNGGAPAGFPSGSFALSAGSLDPAIGFSALNDALNAGGFFGARSFDLQTGNLLIGSNVQAHSVTVSVDAGTLEVAGTINASGAAPGSITLSASNGLTVDAGAVLDAHGTVLQTDSTGAPIDAENKATVTLTVTQGLLTLAPGATIDVSSPEATPQGDVELNVPRTGEVSGNANIVATGPVTIRGAGTVAVNAFWTYTPTDANGTVVQDNSGCSTLACVQASPPIATSGSDSGFVGIDEVAFRNQAFMQAAATNSTLRANLAGLAAYGANFHLRPGVEIESTASGNLTVSGDLDLSGSAFLNAYPGATSNPFRYSDPSGYGLQAGATIGSGEPGVLVLRSADNLNVYGSINDGFYLPQTSVTSIYANNPDNYGWVLESTPTLDGSNLVLPGAVILQSNTTFGNDNVALNYNIPLGGTTVTLNTTVNGVGVVLPTAMSLNQAATLAAGIMLGGNIYTSNGQLLYAAGTLLGSATPLPSGSILGVGTQLPQLTVTGPLSGASQIAFNTTLNLGPGASNTVLTVPEPLASNVTLSASSPWTLSANIVNDLGTILHLAGTTLTSSLTAPTAITAPLLENFVDPGTLPPPGQTISLRVVWPAGANLADISSSTSNTGSTLLPNSVSLAPMRLELTAGSIIPGQNTTLALSSTSGVTGSSSSGIIGTSSCPSNFCSFYAAGNNVWAVAPMLPAGSLSWSFDLVAGASLSAANANTLASPAALMAMASAAPSAPDSITNAAPGSITLNDPHYQLPNNSNKSGQPLTTAPTGRQPSWSVIRTGTGNISLLAGGNIQESSLYGVYTAGTQTTPAPQFMQASRATPLKGTVLGTSFAADAAYNAIAISEVPYYPDDGGNVLVEAQGNVTGDIIINSTNPSSPAGATALDSVGAWLWRQGGVNGQPTAWWINFGTYALPSPPTSLSTEVPTLTGFTGIGTLGGGNVTIFAGGSAGATTPTTNPATYNGSHGLDVAVASTGQETAQGSIAQTGGGAITIDVAGQINPASTTPSAQQDLNGTITDLRGPVNILAGSIGQVSLTYGQTDTNDLLTVSPLTAVQATSFGGLVLVPGDSTFTLATRGDLVLDGVGDATRMAQSNATSLPVSSYCSGASACMGYTWFSLWQPDTAITLYSAGGNITPSTQSASAAVSTSVPLMANSTATDVVWMYPPTLIVEAASGDIYAGGTTAPGGATGLTASSIELAPSPTGQLELLAAGSIYGNQIQNKASAAPAVFDISGASVAALATPHDPAYAIWSVSSQSGSSPPPTSQLSSNVVSSAMPGVQTSLVPMVAPNNLLFVYGPDTVFVCTSACPTSSTGALHAGDPSPALVYAGNNIIDLYLGETVKFGATTWYLASKSVRELAGDSIVEPQGTLGSGSNVVSPYSFLSSSGSTSDLFYNANPTDVSEIEAGQNIIYANASVTGPGQLWVQAGGNVYQSDQATIKSLGANPNAQVGSGGASITVLAGVGAAGPDWTGFANLYLNPANLAASGAVVGPGTSVVAATYADQLLSFLQQYEGYNGTAANALSFFQALPVEQRRQFLLWVYFNELNLSGDEYNDSTSVRFRSYVRGKEAIAALFPAGSSASGDITLSSGFGGGSGTTPIASSIVTLHGGNITLLAPGGEATLGVTSGTPPPPGTGVVTEAVGSIDIYTLGDVALGLSRIFTLSGNSSNDQSGIAGLFGDSNIMIWSATGNVNAGRGANTTSASTPVSYVYNPFGEITVSPSATVTGAGIATLTPLAGELPSYLNLVAPEGIIDAGEAGIRASGNANLAALTIVNAANVQVTGKTTGLPTIVAPNVGAISAASATAAAASQAGQQMAQTASAGAAAQTPSTITVEVTGFGD